MYTEAIASLLNYLKYGWHESDSSLGKERINNALRDGFQYFAAGIHIWCPETFPIITVSSPYDNGIAKNWVYISFEAT